MGMKAVELNVEDSKEFVELLERNAGPDEIEAFLNGKAVGEVSDTVVPALEIIEQLQKLQEDEISILAKCFQVRQSLTTELTALLIDGPKDVKVDGALDPAEETSPIYTDPKTPS